MHLYGLKTCDTCRKAKSALDEAGVDYEFHDFRDTPASRKQIQEWVASLGVDALLNKRSTTWRTLSAGDKSGLTEAKAISLMESHQTLMKRPIIDAGETQIFAGWSKTVQDALLK